MKMLAGWKLKRRKAKVAPARIAAIIAGEPRSSDRAMTLKVSAEMAQTPAARPSSPSMKLTMLMMVAIQQTVKTIADRQEQVDHDAGERHARGG